MKKIAFILFLLFPLITNQLLSQTGFLTFKRKDITSQERYIKATELSEKYDIVDEKLNPYKIPKYSPVFTLYFDDRPNLGLRINTSNLEFIELILDGDLVDPFKEMDLNYPNENFVVDITYVVVDYFSKVYATQYPPGSKDYEKAVESMSKKHLSAGGQLDIRIKYKGQDVINYRLIPENYGFSGFNKTLPINAQYSPSINTDKIPNAVSLYYPLQFIIKDLKRGKTANWTSISNKISFGPYILASIENNVNFLGAGALVGLGFSPKGLPVVGGGVAWIRNESNPVFIFTVNPVEIVRLLFNPTEILKN